MAVRLHSKHLISPLTVLKCQFTTRARLCEPCTPLLQSTVLGSFHSSFGELDIVVPRRNPWQFESYDAVLHLPFHIVGKPSQYVPILSPSSNHQASACDLKRARPNVARQDPRHPHGAALDPVNLIVPVRDPTVDLIRVLNANPSRANRLACWPIRIRNPTPPCAGYPSEMV